MISYKNSKALSASDRKLVESSLDAVLARTDLGFLNIDESSKFLSQVNDLIQSTAQLNIDAVVVVGIGGSFLGAQALWQALKAQIKNSRELLFISSTDPMTLHERLNYLTDKRSYFVYVSKSGQTLETQAVWALVDQWSKNITGEYRACVVTENKSSAMRVRAQEQNLKCVDVPFDVGGRFSVFTPVGLVPLALAGLPISEILKSLTDFKKNLLSGGQLREQVLLLSQMTVDSIKAETVQVSWWSYSDRLKDVGFWWQQLWAESLGQAQNLKGESAPRVPIPIVSVGPQDQHSTLQMFMEGRWPTWSVVVGDLALEKDKSFLIESQFVDFDWVNGKQLGRILATQRKATSEALRQARHQTTDVEIDAVTPASLSQLMQTWMLTIAVAGQSLGVNVFVQPGVELGKRLARQILTKGD